MTLFAHVCSDCGYAFEAVSRVVRVESGMRWNKAYTCPECKSENTTMVDLVAHINELREQGEPGGKT